MTDFETWTASLSDTDLAQLCAALGERGEVSNRRKIVRREIARRARVQREKNA